MGRAAVTIQKKFLQLALPAAALFAFAAATPASAQYWAPDAPVPSYDGRIPAQHIEAMVRSMGFQPVADPRLRGPLWVTHAVDRDGQQVRVLIDSYSGRTIDVLRRPLPPQRVALVPNSAGPAALNGPLSDYEGPDYDYRHMPQQRPADWPPSSPDVRHQGPSIVPLDARSGNDRVPTLPKPKVSKTKEAKKKAEKTAALKQEKVKDETPSPVSRPVEAPKADALKKDAPAKDTPKTAEVPTFVPNADQRPAVTALPPVQSLEMKKNDAANTLPPVQAF